MIWLGIDPGLAIAGWAILKGDETKTPEIIEYGIVETHKSLPTGERLVELEEDFIAIMKEFKPHHVAIEMPFFNRQIKSAGKVLQALGVINLVCYREAQITPIFLHQASWKAHLGNGRATKDEVAEILQQIFDLPELPINDSVDAIAIAYGAACGLRNSIN
ncbi:MAG: crossover junction endodeoxyribonuclease RuvC [Cyanobacteria bacterium]|uniref:crossover junction endodeoxyribonuclease RuvC n=1 Tax=Geminocystis sp. TaxID=2664100 RepID=UPI001D9F0250|nr:crossover junction endodeoxyribonuclease RuvC [Cyanobacteria bacterium CG_2015-16_32_12]NCO79315.1 crossover junction endodeoxyribonuclease RuvC [Cyanobacteria bacterium CG_2015-22_32_23]NCQ05037.1 crossover junction endodeoxyribonuclease RuvC [Cyanobacteria bacterium CG_2015-09_32_10]NCQ41339.1 crossover junction endodeoxyribonuclease RuvC [Cyanobacteria bacterium CG_2015-04_32_10]